MIPEYLVLVIISAICGVVFTLKITFFYPGMASRSTTGC